MNIALVSDFFHPAVGGCEVHLMQLGARLMRLGHRVIVITHAMPGWRGECLVGPLRVFYIDQLPFYNNTSFPTIFTTLPALRDILLREGVQLVHGHSAFSVLAHEAMLHASVMGIATCFTDHSLFGFQDASSILTNKLLRASLAAVGQVICVSHTSKENTVLRAHIDPEQVNVIGNAIDASLFTPDPSARDPQWITIVFCARLELRKGADLLVQLLPRVCRALPNARFLIAGDGKKRHLVEEARDAHALGGRVVLLGNLKHTEVRGVLVQGNIFLNTSLTEAFCMAIVEAACCGCYVVSTNVGGIPEVLPSDMVSLANPDADDLLQKILEAVPKLRAIDAVDLHKRVSSMYDWGSVAVRTAAVYEKALARKKSHKEILTRYQERCGFWWGRMFCIIFVLDLLLLWFLARMVGSMQRETVTNQSRKKTD